MCLSYTRLHKSMVWCSTALLMTSNWAKKVPVKDITSTWLNRQWSTVHVLDIHQWSCSHHLKLNAAKSEVIWLGTRQQLAKLHQVDVTVHISDTVLQPPTVVRNLDVYIDDQLYPWTSLCHDVLLIYTYCESLHAPSREPWFITVYALIRALMLSRLDYCNSLFACSPQLILRRLQRVQDAAVRLLCMVHLLGRMHRLSWSVCIY